MNMLLFLILCVCVCVCVCVWFVFSGQENILGWESAEEDGKKKGPFSCPLLTCRIPVFSLKTHTLKVRAASVY